MRKFIPGHWSAKQLQLQQLEANPFDERTLAEKCIAVGVGEKTIYRWRHLPGWRDAVYDIARRWIGDKAPDVLRALVNTAKTGDTAAIKLYLEVTGRYVQHSELDFRVGRLEELSDEQLREIIERGTAPEGGGGQGITEETSGEQNNLLPPPQTTGEVSQEPSNN